MSDYPELLSIDEVATILGVSPMTCRRLGLEGEITYTLVGKRRKFKFHKRSVDAYLSRNTQRSTYAE